MHPVRQVDLLAVELLQLGYEALYDLVDGLFLIDEIGSGESWPDHAPLGAVAREVHLGHEVESIGGFAGALKPVDGAMFGCYGVWYFSSEFFAAVNHPQDGNSQYQSDLPNGEPAPECASANCHSHLKASLMSSTYCKPL